MDIKYIYSPGYDISLPCISRLHPFDGKKYSKAAKILKHNLGGKYTDLVSPPTCMASDETLLNIHSRSYIQSLNSSSTIASIMEIKLAGFLPNGILQKYIIEPIRLATQGTIEATLLALDNNMVMNIGGGFHHAFADRGEGFCFFSDAALAIENARSSNKLGKNDHIFMIDLDAHRGNGFEEIYRDDSSVHIFDMYNFQVYPGLHEAFPETKPFSIPLKSHMNGEKYLDTLRLQLSQFFKEKPKPSLVFYNAGTDILNSDALGALSVSYNDVIARDQFILDLLASQNVPSVLMTSGGYSKRSFELVANLAVQLSKVY
jgi:histone deacetylase 11